MPIRAGGDEIEMTVRPVRENEPVADGHRWGRHANSHRDFSGEDGRGDGVGGRHEVGMRSESKTGCVDRRRFTGGRLIDGHDAALRAAGRHGGGFGVAIAVGGGDLEAALLGSGSDGSGPAPRCGDPIGVGRGRL
ncbi:hypothetical protein SDC9_106735 [bioreactor metagenome]|uniref:Uncharacterized protein n=1 Tax=bioreactor metagenome TaxID=1076179 RepID=A0A645B384_9ZZZZ